MSLGMVGSTILPLKRQGSYAFLLETELVENLPDLVVPVFRAAAQAVKCPF